MTKAKFQRVIAFVLALTLAVSTFTAVAFATTGYVDEDEVSNGETTTSTYNSSSYLSYLYGQLALHRGESTKSDEELLAEIKEATKNQLGDAALPTVDLSDFIATEATKENVYLNGVYQGNPDDITDDIRRVENELKAIIPSGATAIYLPEEGTVTFKLNVPVAGFYGVKMEYFPYAISGKISSAEKKLTIDGQLLCSELTALNFSKNWEYTYIYVEDEDGAYVFVADANGSYTLPDEAKTKGNFVLKAVAQKEGLTSFDNKSYSASFNQDKNGNDIRADYGQVPEWRTYTVTDASGFYRDEMQFYFSAGEHEISLSGVREGLLLKSLSLFLTKDKQSYADYYESIKNKEDSAANAGIFYMEAEKPIAVSDSSVYPSNDRSSAITSPSDAAAQLLNVIGKTGFSTVGQWAAYEFSVSATGYYDFGVRFQQKALEGMFVSRVLKIWSSDGKFGEADGTPTAPFSEAYRVRFNYKSDWQTTNLGYYDQNNAFHKFTFYFEEGVTYKIYMEVGLGDMASVIETVQNSLNIINESYLNILKLTGASPDEYRSYNFKRVMPRTIQNLADQADILTGVVETMKQICGTTGSNTATLVTIAELLRKMGESESEIAKNLGNLKSYIGNLGTWLNTVKSQAITMDYITVQPADSKLPRANANPFVSAWFEICAFVTSFFTDYNSMGVQDSTEKVGEIDVWLAYGRDQSLIWRNLVDDQFTNTTGVAVQLKLVTAGTLLPSVLCGQGPDVYIGLGSSDTINYAIRSAIVPLYDESGKTQHVATEQEYNNFISVAFPDSALVPITLYDLIYGIPETSSFQMMFLREDILDNLGIDVPLTWDHILAAIPVLQANNMEIGITYASAFKIFLYQRGGGLWMYNGTDGSGKDSIYAGAQIAYGTNTALDAFSDVCRLYTDYSFPVAFDAANRFRTGEMPLMISDYVTTYNQLVVFATEIAGLWSFTAVPGTENLVFEKNADGSYVTDADGEKVPVLDPITKEQVVEINRDSMTTVTATIMLYNQNRDAKTTQQAWQFMQWQCGTQAQADYGNRMVALIGPSAKYATANMEAVKNLSWTAAEYNCIIDQMGHLSAIENYPGSYYIARYEQFAFYEAYNDGTEAATALQNYINVINKEISRKRAEFDLPTLDIGQTPEDVRNAGK